MHQWKRWSATLLLSLATTSLAQPGGDDKPKGPPGAEQPQSIPQPNPGPRQPQPGQPGQPNQPGMPGGSMRPHVQQRGPMQPGQPMPGQVQPNPMPPGMDPRMQQWQRARVFIQPPGKKEKAAFLGVSGSPVTPALREQLKLPKGVGLVVDFVEPKSPADEAGIKQYDVLHKMGDQLLINAHQFATLVRMHKSGDEVELTVIRQGEAKQVKVKLGEKEVMALDDNNPWGMPPGPWEDTAGAEVMTFTPKMIGVGGSGGGGFGGAIPGGGPGFHATFKHNGEGLNEQMVWKDDDGELTITTDSGGRHYVMKDKSGKTTYVGRLDTPEQKQALPQALREKIERLENTRPHVEGFPYPLKDVQGEIRVGEGGFGGGSGGAAGGPAQP